MTVNKVKLTFFMRIFIEEEEERKKAGDVITFYHGYYKLLTPIPLQSHFIEHSSRATLDYHSSPAKLIQSKKKKTFFKVLNEFEMLSQLK